MRIQAASTLEEIATVRELFAEYWQSFGFTPCFQGFAEELASLPGKYAPPDGRLALATSDAGAGGCIASRRVDDRRVEMKRLYVRPSFRGQGIGAALIEYILEEARSAGYVEIVADTMPVMKDALEMYQRRGFELTGPYTGEPTPGAVYLRLPLTQFDQTSTK